MKIECIAAVLLIAVFVFSGCGGDKAANDAQSKPKELFPPDLACTYPLNAPGKVFSNLGGGVWAASDPGDPNSSFECAGLNSVVRIFADDRSNVDVEYTVTGVRDGASMITLTYRASGGPILNESTLRNAFTNLADIICRNALGNPLPDLARRKLSNLKSYSQSDNTENFDVGTGFISLSRTTSVDGRNITAALKYYPDVGFKLVL